MTNLEKYDRAFVQALGVKKEELGESLVYRRNENWDSVGHMDLVVRLEEAFDISISSPDVMALNTYERARRFWGNTASHSEKGGRAMIFGIDERPPIRPAAYGEGGEVYSYGRLCADAARVAACTPGRPLVFSFCENSYGALCGYAGFLSGGAVPLLLDAGMHRELLDGLLETYRPGFLWLPERMAGGFPGTKRLLSLEGYALLGRGEAPPAMHPDLALLLTTSGSTGSPKLVRQSRRNIESNARAIVRYLEIGEEERAITTLPMNYTYGLSIVQSHLLAGASLILTGRSVVEPEFWALFREREATSFGGVPYTYEILKRVGFFGMELPSLRYFTQAGGKLPPELHETCARYADAHGKRFYVMYGQTEATARMGYLPWERALEKRGCMGIAIPGGRFTLLDVDGAAIDSARRSGGSFAPRGQRRWLRPRAADLAKGTSGGACC